MRLNIVVAMSTNCVIGRNGTLPWRLSADLQHFKTITMSHPLIMGRKTHESIGRPLPGRMNIVVSAQPGYRAPGCAVADSLDRAAQIAGTVDEVMVIGGASLYAEALVSAGRIYITEVHADVEGDTRFPAFDRSRWQEIEREAHAADEHNEHDYSFVVLDRKGKADTGEQVSS